MDKEELIQFLRDNLSLVIDESRGWYGDHYVNIKLTLEGDTFTSATIDMPKECNCKCGRDY